MHLRRNQGKLKLKNCFMVPFRRTILQPSNYYVRRFDALDCSSAGTKRNPARHPAFRQVVLEAKDWIRRPKPVEAKMRCRAHRCTPPSTAKPPKHPHRTKQPLLGPPNDRDYLHGLKPKERGVITLQVEVTQQGSADAKFRPFPSTTDCNCPCHHRCTGNQCRSLKP